MCGKCARREAGTGVVATTGEARSWVAVGRATTRTEAGSACGRVVDSGAKAPPLQGREAAARAGRGEVVGWTRGLVGGNEEEGLGTEDLADKEVGLESGSGETTGREGREKVRATPLRLGPAESGDASSRGVPESLALDSDTCRQAACARESLACARPSGSEGVGRAERGGEGVRA